MSEKKKKRQIAKISVFITSIFVILSSVTYAFITQTLTGEKQVVINAGTLELVLEEDENNLTITDALPMYDEVGMIQDAFTFRLINKTANDTDYVLKLVEIGTGTLSKDIVKYGFVKEDDTTIDFVSNIGNGIIDTGTIVGNDTIEYSLRLWIDASVTDENLIAGKSLSYRIDVEVGQLIEFSMTDVLVTGVEFNATIPATATAVVFTDEVAPEGVTLTDVSSNQDNSIVGWSEGTTYKVSSQREGVYIQGNPDSSEMFSGKTKLTQIDLTNFKTDYIKNMYKMFRNCINVTTLDVSNWNTSKVENMGNMFAGSSADNLMKLTSLDVSNWDTSNVTTMRAMFQGCASLTNLDVSNWDTSKVIDMAYMFNSVRTLTSLDVSNWVISNVTTMRAMFQSCTSLTSLDISTWDTGKVEDMRFMFSGDSKVGVMKLATLDVSKWDTSNVTTMRGMFQHCTSLTNLDISKWNTSKVTDMALMFTTSNGTMKLTSLDVSNWDTSKVTDMEGMFQNCASLASLDVSNWNTSQVTNMSYMFNKVSSLTNLDISNWDTSKVTDMSYMFNKVSSLTNLDISNWDMSKVQNTYVMFQDCKKLDITVPASLKVYSSFMLNHLSSYSKETFTISKNVATIGKSHMWYDFGTNAFKQFIVEDSNQYFKTIDDSLYTKDGKRLIAVPRGKIYENGTFEIPEGVTFMNELSFSRNSNITKVILPNSFEIKYYSLNHADYDKDNVNAGSNLNIAIYTYTSIKEYEVKSDNPNYTSIDGCVYSNDGSTLIAVPSKYEGILNVVEGTTTIAQGALLAIDGMTALNIPSSVTSIDNTFIQKVNAATNLTITVDSANANYTVVDGKLTTK